MGNANPANFMERQENQRHTRKLGEVNGSLQASRFSSDAVDTVARVRVYAPTLGPSWAESTVQ
jgi:hypothetical protein